MITTQAKIHFISLAVATVLIGALYLVFLPSDKQAAPVVANEESNYVISIHGATYGENCQAYITHNNKIRLRSNPPRETLNDIKPNNALRLISQACADQSLCELNISPQTMEFDPAPNCSKQLRIQYRCFAFDTMREAIGGDGKKMLLDCRLD